MNEAGETEATRLLHGLRGGPPGRTREAAADVLVQRRPGLLLGVAAPGRAGPAARADARRRRAAGAALRAGGQRAHVARPDRPRVHRPRGHRLQPRRRSPSWARSSGACRATSSRSASSSGSTSRATSAGPRRCSWSARATARRARPGLAGLPGGPRASRSTASCSCRRSSTSRPRASRTGNDLPYVLFLPTYAATAWYHKQLPADLQQRPLREFLAEVERWAAADYHGARWRRATALTRGRAARRSCERLARYTGLDPRTWTSHRPAHRDPPLLQGAAARPEAHGGPPRQPLQGLGPARGHRRPDFDPSMAAIRPPYTAMFNDYVRRALGYKSDLTYHILGRRHRPLGLGLGGRAASRTPSEALRSAFAKNPHMKLFVASGLLRPGHALLRHRVHAAPPGPRPEPARQHQHRRLRGRAHDVHPRRRAGAAEARTSARSWNRR